MRSESSSKELLALLRIKEQQLLALQQEIDELKAKINGESLASEAVEPSGVDDSECCRAVATSNLTADKLKSGTDSHTGHHLQSPIQCFTPALTTYSRTLNVLGSRLPNRPRSSFRKLSSMGRLATDYIPEELRLRKEDIQLQARVGKGSFGEVWRGKAP